MLGIFVLLDNYQHAVVDDVRTFYEKELRGEETKIAA
jgi:hypothetical protein